MRTSIEQQLRGIGFTASASAETEHKTGVGNRFQQLVALIDETSDQLRRYKGDKVQVRDIVTQFVEKAHDFQNESCVKRGFVQSLYSCKRQLLGYEKLMDKGIRLSLGRVRNEIEDPYSY